MSGPFTRRATALLLGLGGVSLAAAVALWVVEPESVPRTSANADAFSSSAIGHRAFVELLRALGVPVVVSRFDSGRRAGRSAVLLLAEPQVAARGRPVGQLVGSAGIVLLVLPKWHGREAPDHAGRIAAAELLPAAGVDAVLQAAGLPAHVRRRAGAGPKECEGAPGAVDLPMPQYLEPNPGGSLRPVMTCPDGVLAAELIRPAGGRVLVLSDPDLLSNHGLARGANAAAAVGLVEAAREGRRAVVVDETLHGYLQPPSVWRALLGPPLLPGVLQAVIAGLMLVWAGVRRFGSPLPAEPAVAAGKATLIENTAALLQMGPHEGHTLGRYLEAAVHDVARALHVAGGDGPALRARLSTLGRRRGATDDLPALEAAVARAQGGARVAPGLVVATARRVHRWRKEMLVGSHRSRVA